MKDSVLDPVAAAFGDVGIAPGTLINGMRCHNHETTVSCREVWAWVERNHQYGERIAEWLDRHNAGNGQMMTLIRVLSRTKNGILTHEKVIRGKRMNNWSGVG